MRIIMIGCEYVGKSTLAVQISRWMIRTMGLPSVRWHAHFVLPHLDRHILVPDSSAETPVERRKMRRSYNCRRRLRSSYCDT